MTRRKEKKTAAPRLESWAAVDGSLREIAELKRRVASAEALAAEEVDRIKRRLADVVEPLAGSIRFLEKSVESYTRAHAAELEGRSRKLNFGAVSLRLTSSIPLPRGKEREKIIDALKARHPRTWRNSVKVSETLSVQGLQGFSDEALGELGLKRKKEDSFSYELFDLEHRPAPDAPPKEAA